MISIGFTISHKLATFENWQKWYCGSDDETRRHSYKTIAEECPDVLDQFNECCWVHDQCYADQLGKINCDNHFCQCLDIIAMKAKHYDDCKMNAWWACFAVQVFGDHAYVASASQNRTMKTSTVTKKDTTTTNAPTVCVIDDEEVHEHYKMASNTCRDQKNEFTKCCEQHTMCHRNLSNNPKFCHKAFASCLIDHINEDNNSDSDCRKAAYLIYNELSGEGSDEPKECLQLKIACSAGHYFLHQRRLGLEFRRGVFQFDKLNGVLKDLLKFLCLPVPYINIPQKRPRI
ncbi:unnamed protein product [Dracunculus medinensis]|uniref:PA2c domain-containing protein n=1 Tax=Dracunculus medinensis TaxID=318479 RepID=A0A0N4U499_DRAME|nr:unnamed protein product [Dracunculus medinensis]